VSSVVTGVLELLQDVAMESGDAGQFVITTSTAPVVGDHATLHFTDAMGTQSIRVRVVESQLRMVRDAVRYRVRLVCIDDASALDPRAGSLMPDV
jgi:hypothetical protein